MFTWKTALCVLAIGVHVCAEKASALYVSNIPACTSRPVRICAGDVKLQAWGSDQLRTHPPRLSFAWLQQGDAPDPEPSLEPSLQAPQLTSSGAAAGGGGAFLAFFTTLLNSFGLPAAKDAPHLGLRLAYTPDANRAWGA